MLSKGIFRLLKIDLRTFGTLSFTRQSFARLFAIFFPQSQETSPNGFPTHFASITQFFSGGKKTADALSTLFLMLAKWEGKKARRKRGGGEWGREDRMERHEMRRKVREMSSETTLISRKIGKGGRMCLHWPKRHIMKPYERKCRLHSRDVTPEKFSELSPWLYGVSWIPTAGRRSSLESNLPGTKISETFFFNSWHLTFIGIKF